MLADPGPTHQAAPWGSSRTPGLADASQRQELHGGVGAAPFTVCTAQGLHPRTSLPDISITPNSSITSPCITETDTHRTPTSWGCCLLTPQRQGLPRTNLSPISAHRCECPIRNEPGMPPAAMEKQHLGRGFQPLTPQALVPGMCTAKTQPVHLQNSSLLEVLLFIRFLETSPCFPRVLKSCCFSRQTVCSHNPGGAVTKWETFSNRFTRVGKGFKHRGCSLLLALANCSV